MPSTTSGLTRIVKATKYSQQGLAAAWKYEEAFRQEVVLSLILIPLALWLGDTGVERALMVGSVFVVLITEILNSAIEATVDRFGEELHELAGRAKDMASAAVSLSLANVVVIWLLVFFW